MCINKNGKCFNTGKDLIIFNQYGEFCEEKCDLLKIKEETKKMKSAFDNFANNVDWTKEPIQRDEKQIMDLFNEVLK